MMLVQREGRRTLCSFVAQSHWKKLPGVCVCECRDRGSPGEVGISKLQAWRGGGDRMISCVFGM